VYTVPGAEPGSLNVPPRAVDAGKRGAVQAVTEVLQRLGDELRAADGDVDQARVGLDVTAHAGRQHREVGRLVRGDERGHAVRVGEHHADRRDVHPDLRGVAPPDDEVEPPVVVDVEHGHVVGAGQHRVGNHLTLLREGRCRLRAVVAVDVHPPGAAGDVHVHVGDEHVVVRVVVEVGDDRVPAEAGAGRGEDVGAPGQQRRAALVQQEPVLAVVDHDDVEPAVGVEVAHRGEVRGEVVDGLVGGEEALTARVVVRHRHVRGAAERRLLDDVVRAVTVHVGDVAGGAERRLDHLRGEAGGGRIADRHRRLVGEIPVAVVDEQAVVVVEHLAAAGVVVAEVKIRGAVPGHVAVGHRAEPRAGRGVHQRDAGVLVLEALPDAGVLAEVDVDARVREVLRLEVGERRGGDDVEPAVPVDVHELHVAVVGRREKALVAGHVGGRRVLGGPVGEDAVEGVAFRDALVHEEQVRLLAGRGERLLPHDHEIGVAVVVDVAPRVVLLLGVGRRGGGIDEARRHAARRLVDEVHPFLTECRHDPGEGGQGDESVLCS
jgi:hypothetical protein